MKKTDMYRQELRQLKDWDEYLLLESGLPGPRGNIELAQAVADEGDETLFRRYLGYTAEKAPTGTGEEFLAFCGVVGLGRLLAEGRVDLIEDIRVSASDERWRIREGVAMALQSLGDVDMQALLNYMKVWSRGNLYEKRAAAAALCEPRLLKDQESARQTLDLLDLITSSIKDEIDRKAESFKALKKGLAYCWSVAVAAFPDYGKPFMEKWLKSEDANIKWIIKENLKKKRLQRVDKEWVDTLLT